MAGRPLFLVSDSGSVPKIGPNSSKCAQLNPQPITADSDKPGYTYPKLSDVSIEHMLDEK